MLEYEIELTAEKDDLEKEQEMSLSKLTLFYISD